MTDYTPHLLWFDCETTGLAPTSAVLEVAWVISDHQLVPTSAIRQTLIDNGDRFLTYDNGVHAMHAASGLLTDLDDTSLQHATITDTANAILDDIAATVGGDSDVLLAGSGLQFDRAIIAHHMPRLHSRLHYRHADVSPIRTMLRMWRPDLIAAPTTIVHRAAADVADAFHEADCYRQILTDVTRDVT